MITDDELAALARAAHPQAAEVTVRIYRVRDDLWRAEYTAKERYVSLGVSEPGPDEASARARLADELRGAAPTAEGAQ